MTATKIFWLSFYYGFCRWLPGCNTFWGKVTFSKKLRYICCKHIFKSIGAVATIERGAWFGKGTYVELGNRSGIGYYAHLNDRIKIGDNVLMGQRVVLLPSIHRHDRTDIPMIDQGRTEKLKQDVVIEDDCWIGNDVLFIGDRRIAKGSIVAARTVVCKSFPEYSMIGGNPSRLIRSRLEEK